MTLLTARRSLVRPTEIARREALCELLALPDPVDIKRGHKLKVGGKADRYNQLPALYAGYVAGQQIGET